MAIATLLMLLPCSVRAASPMTYLLSAGAAAHPVMRLAWGLLAVSVIVILVITAFVLLGVLRKRPAMPLDAAGRPPVSHGGNGLPWIYIGVGISSVVLFGCTVWMYVVLAAVAQPPGDPKLTLDVTGHQWWWEVRYRREGQPGRTFLTANEIHLPVGQPVRVRLISDNVIHSFWVPQLAGKMDVIPGQTNVAWLEADKPGVYRGQCTEYCGVQHAHMALQVVAEDGQKFKAWWDHQLQKPKPPASAQARRGQQVFQSHCSVCHTVRGAGFSAHGIVGPDLTHVMSRRRIAAGTLLNTTGYLAAWIANAQALKPGVEMPTMDLTSRQLVDVVAYVKTLH